MARLDFFHIRGVSINLRTVLAVQYGTRKVADGIDQIATARIVQPPPALSVTITDPHDLTRLLNVLGYIPSQYGQWHPLQKGSDDEHDHTAADA